MAFAPGATLSFFEILGSLGAGGMGEVYRARDTRLDREVALKVLSHELAQDPVQVRRFQREARVLASLDHPNVVSVHSVENAGGVHFLTMGLVRGRELVELIPVGGMSPEVLLPLARSIAEGLSAAHAHGIVHRDLKPANIMVTEAGQVRIVDFGLAKPEACDDPALDLSNQGVAVGTVPYMSPEQLRGAGVDARSDIFSLGAVLFEMATGTRAFGGDSAADVITSILNGERPPFASPCRELAPELGSVVERCLNTEPARRYSSVGALLGELIAIERGTRAAASSAAAEPGEPPGSDLPLPSRPSLAVLPFVNLGGDPAEDCLATGIWFDLNAELVKLAGLFLLNGTSTATYAGRAIDPRQTGQELGVRHILQGTVRRAGGRIRITVQLTDTESGAPIWADRFEREISDLFILQDEINAGILDALDVQLLYGEGARTMRASFADPSVRDLFYRAVPLSFSSEMADLERARGLLDEVERREPGSAQTYSHIGWTHYFEATTASCIDPEPSFANAREFAARSIEEGDAGGMGYMLMATLHLLRGHHTQARDAGKVALDRRPGCPWAYAVLGNIYNYVGEPHRAIPLASRAIRLSPLVPDLFPAVLATSYYLVGRPEDAVAAARSAIELDGDRLDAHLVLAAALSASDRSEEAPPIVAEILQIRPDFTLEAFSRQQPYRDRGDLDRLLADLRRGGL